MNTVAKTLTGVVLGVSCLPAFANEATPSSGPTFYKDILPVFQENCQQCHRPGGYNIAGMVAPFSLMTYEEARPWAKSIVQKITAREMPPWFTTKQFAGVFGNERSLADSEIAMITDWAGRGAARGNPADGPPARVFEGHDGWLQGVPDIIVTMKEPYFVEDGVEDIYQNFESEPITAEQLPRDRWLRAIEWRGDSTAVHHIVGSATITTPEGRVARYSLGSIAPGEEAAVFPAGYGRLMKAGSTINFNMHYHKETGEGTGVWDQSMVGFSFWDEETDPPIHHAVQREGISNRYFEIPPGNPSWAVTAAKTFDADTTILSLHPHMHLRGKDCKYEAVYPDGRREMLLDVPKWDFNWQLDYTYREPKRVPAGTRIEYSANFDNSSANVSNPDATIPMVWGGPTTMEMHIGYISYTNSTPMESAALQLVDSNTVEDSAD